MYIGVRKLYAHNGSDISNMRLLYVIAQIAQSTFNYSRDRFSPAGSGT